MRCVEKLLNEQGSAILIALAILTILTTVAIMAVDQSNDQIDMSFNQLHADQAFYVANAGLKQGTVELSKDKTWRAGLSNIAFSGGTFDLDVKDSVKDSTLADTVILTATATVDMARSTVEFTMVPDLIRPFQYALLGDSSVEFKNSARTDSYNSDSGSYASTMTFADGDVGSNGIIDMKAKSDIGGDISTFSDGGITLFPGSNIGGDTTSKAAYSEIPEISQSEYDYAKANNSNLTGISGKNYSYSSGSYALSISKDVELQSGTYYFSSIILDNNATIKPAKGAEVTIYVTGNIEVKAGATVNDGGRPRDFQIYSQGDLNLKNSGNFNATFYSPTGTADLANKGDVYGSIVAYNIVVNNSAGFHFDRDLLKERRWSIRGYKVVAWREL